MPTYSYKCLDCGTKYEVFHKSREDEKSIVCPSCNSSAAKKVMSTMNISTTGSKAVLADNMGGACERGECPCYN